MPKLRWGASKAAYLIDLQLAQTPPTMSALFCMIVKSRLATQNGGMLEAEGWPKFRQKWHGFKCMFCTITLFSTSVTVVQSTLVQNKLIYRDHCTVCYTFKSVSFLLQLGSSCCMLYSDGEICSKICRMLLLQCSMWWGNYFVQHIVVHVRIFRIHPGTAGTGSSPHWILQLHGGRGLVLCSAGNFVFSVNAHAITSLVAIWLCLLLLYRCDHNLSSFICPREH